MVLDRWRSSQSVLGVLLMTEKYSKIMLTVIAVALVVIAVRPILPRPFGDCGRYQGYRCLVYIASDFDNDIGAIRETLDGIERRMGDAPDFVEVGEAGIAVDHAMRR